MEQQLGLLATLAKSKGMKSFRHKGIDYDLNRNPLSNGTSLSDGAFGAIQTGASILDAAGQQKDGTTNVGLSSASGALKFGSMGLQLGGPIGGGIGAVLGAGYGAYNAIKGNEEIEERKKQQLEQQHLVATERSNSINNSYESKGVTRRGYFGLGGKSATILPLISNGSVAEVEGNKHEEGGVSVPTLDNENVEVEGGEVIKDGEKIFSDRLHINGKTFADIAKTITERPLYKKLTNKLHEAKEKSQSINSNEYQKGSADRIIETNPDPLDILFQIQESMKNVQPIKKYGLGGYRKLFRPNPNDGDPIGPTNNVPGESLNPTDVLNKRTYTRPDGTVIGAGDYMMNSLKLKPPVDTSKVAKTRSSMNPLTPPEEESGVNYSTLIDKGLKSITPYLDNVTNAILTAKTPQPSVPILNANPTLNTKYDVSAPMADIDRMRELRRQFLTENSSNSNNVRASELQGHANDVYAKNQIYGQKINAETDLKNKQALITAQNTAQNNQTINNYNNVKYGLNLDKQARISANVTDAVNDTLFSQQQSEAKIKDTKQLALVAMKYLETGVLERSGYDKVLQAIDNGADLSTALETLKKHKKGTH